MGIKQVLPPRYKSTITIKQGTPYVKPKPQHKVYYIPKECLYHSDNEGKYNEGFCSKTVMDNGEVIHSELRCQRDFGFCPDYVPQTVKVYRLKGYCQDLFGTVMVDSYFISKEEMDEEYNLCHQMYAKVKLKPSVETLKYYEAKKYCKNLSEYVKQNLNFYDKKARDDYYKKEAKLKELKESKDIDK